MLTLIEMSALVIVVVIGFVVMARGDGDLSRITVFDSQSDRGLFLAVTVATTEDPERIFPKVMLTGLGIAVLFYVLVAISVIAVIPAGEIDKIFPFLTVVAAANTALLNMLMASRLLYGMANQDVLPRTLGKVLPGRRTPYAGIAFSTALAFGLIIVVTFAADTSIIGALSGTTSLLLLTVFAVVNVACLVLRRDRASERGFTAPVWTGSSTRSPAGCC